MSETNQDSHEKIKDTENFRVLESGDKSDDEDSYRERNSVHSSDEEDGEDALDGLVPAPPTQPDSEDSVEYVRKYLADKFGIDINYPNDEQTNPTVLSSLDVDGIVEYIKDGRAKNIIVMAGAGISTSAGIPDFRTPGSGLYDNLQKYNLPYPQAVFDIGYFAENPKPFFTLAKELYPGSFNPTPSHYFVKLLEEKGLLLRHFTQNIDTLERVAGISNDKIVEAHGAFHTGHCIKCRKEFSQEWIKELIFKDEIPTCTKESCKGYVKPDIVFFGEGLPDRFFNCMMSDFKKCDLLIIMGTSLAVQPFASLVDHVGDTCPRMLLNMEKVGEASDLARIVGGQGLKFDGPGAYRDVAMLGACDDSCRTLADKLGWAGELEGLVTKSG